MSESIQSIGPLLELLKTKGGAKQQTYRNASKAFNDLKHIGDAIVREVQDMIKPIDDSIIVEFKEINETEFHLKFSGDLLVFLMQSNIITLNPEHELMKSDYVKENENRGYFGHIMVYNFLSDSYKYNRLDDPGYLIARLLINCENHFFIEGVKPLNFLFPDISANKINKPMFKLFIEKAMVAAIEHDLVAPNYVDIRNVSLVQLLNQHKELGRGHKIGFHMSHED